MMRRIALAALILLLPGLASAQMALIAPTAPPATNNDQIANTAFVQSAISAFAAAAPTGAVGLTVVPGVATTLMRSDAAPPLSASVQSALTGTLNQILIGTGAFGFTAIALGGDCTFTSPNITCTKVNGVSFGASPATDTVPVVTAANTTTWTGVTNCTAGILQYTTATHLFSCGATPVNSFNALTGTVTTSVIKQTFCASGCTTTVAGGGSGTYTPTAGMLHAIIECVGGGGGGGGTAGGAGTTNVGSGGGSGGYSRTYTTAAAVGASKVVTNGAAGTGATAGNNAGGAGGDTSVGTLCVGKGGGGGGGSNSTGALGAPGAGGIAGTGDVIAAGMPGLPGFATTINSLNSSGGGGGSSIFGGGAVGQISTANGAGAAGNNYGSGGAGGASNSSAVATGGGAGSAGIVVITEFINL